mgnify:CR=1 FL=1
MFYLISTRYQKVVKIKDIHFLCEEFENGKKKERNDHLEWRFEPQIFSNFPKIVLSPSILTGLYSKSSGIGN